MQVGWVYLIGNPEHNIYKIGFSLKHWERLRQLDDGPFPMIRITRVRVEIPDDVPMVRSLRSIERRLHTYFKALGLHLRKEWYQAKDPVLFAETFRRRAKEIIVEEVTYLEVETQRHQA